MCAPAVPPVCPAFLSCHLAQGSRAMALASFRAAGRAGQSRQTGPGPIVLICCGRRSQVTRRPSAPGTERPRASPWGHRGRAGGLVGRNTTCSASCHNGRNAALCEVTSAVPVTSEFRRGGQDSKRCLSPRSTCHGHLTSAVQGSGDGGGDWRGRGTDVGKRHPACGPPGRLAVEPKTALCPRRARGPGFGVPHASRRAVMRGGGWPASQGPGPAATGFRRC